MSIFIPSNDKIDSYSKYESNRRFEKKDPNIVKLSAAGQTNKIIKSNGSTWLASDVYDPTNIDRVAIGSQAGLNQQIGTVAIGSSAGSINQNLQAIAIGYGAGSFNQATSAVSVGNLAGCISQGLYSVSLGFQAGNTHQGNNSVAIGVNSGSNTQGLNSISIGHKAGYTSQGPESVAMGQSAGEFKQGGQSVAIGNQAGQTNQYSTSICIGSNAGYLNAGTGSVCIGNLAGYENSGKNSVNIGPRAGLTNSSNFENYICINSDFSVPLYPGSSNSCFIKPLRVSTGTHTLNYNTSTFEITAVASSERYKENIRNVDNSESIYSLQAKIYDMKGDNTRNNTNVIGFVAEDINKVDPRLVLLDENDQPVNYNDRGVIALMLEEMKKLRLEIDELKK